METIPLSPSILALTFFATTQQLCRASRQDIPTVSFTSVFSPSVELVSFGSTVAMEGVNLLPI